jgi:putative RNA 2'-phosphotransferase
MTIPSVQAARMHANGHMFFCADNGVWLTDHVPATYLGFDAIGGLTSSPSL